MRLSLTRNEWLLALAGAALLLVALLAVVGIAFTHPWALLALLAFGVTWKPLQVLRSGATGLALVPVLAATGLFEVAYAVLLAAGLWLA